MKQLLLLHGALGSAALFGPLQAALADHFSTLAIDFPGHGAAPAAQDFSIPYFAEAVLQHLDAQGIGRVGVFGYSMGGYVALYLAVHHPDRVENITTLGTKLDWTPEGAARETAMLDPEKILAKVPQFAETLRQRHQALDWQEVLRQTAGLMLRLGNGGALTRAEFETIQCPVLIGRGALDNMVSRESSEQVADWIPKARYMELPDTKHPLEQVDVEMLRRLTADGRRLTADARPSASHDG